MNPEDLTHNVALVARAESAEAEAHHERLRAERAEQDAASWCSKWAAMRDRAERAEDAIRAWAERERRLEAALAGVLCAYDDADKMAALDRAATVWNDLQKRHPPPVDEPIADPAERAKAVAKELRRRGFRAKIPDHYQHLHIAITWHVEVLQPDSDDCDGIMYPLHTQGVTWTSPEQFERWNTMGPLAIADEIQKEEARRAQEWAGEM